MRPSDAHPRVGRSRTRRRSGGPRPPPAALRWRQGARTNAASPEPSVPAGDFRRYRRFVSWFVLTFVFLGSAYMLVSVAVTLYRRNHAVPLGSPVGAQATRAEADGCYDELSDVVEGLQKHLESSRALLVHYDTEEDQRNEVQRWADAGSYWRGQWKAIGDRCRFELHRGEKNWAEMGVVHDELHETEAAYTKEILYFGKE